jgi:hypothetical protein
LNEESLRSALWRSKDKPPPPPASFAREVDTDDALELLRTEIVETRRTALDALGKTAGVAAQGLGSEARNLAVVHASLSQRASDLEADLHRAEQHRAGLIESQAEQLHAVAVAWLGAFQVPQGGAMALLAALLEQVDRHEPLEPPDELAARVRAELRSRVRAEVRPELLAELHQAEGQPPAPSPAEAQPAGERIYADEPEPAKPAASELGDDLPEWEALPAVWRERYAMSRDLGRWEYLQACRREVIARGRPAAPPRSRWEMPRPAELGGQP